MKIREVLKAKGSVVHSVAPDQSVAEALDIMNRHRVGCLMVIGPDGAPQGILSERDILGYVLRSGGNLAEGTVSRIMTGRGKLIIATEDDDLDYAMRVMTENRIRHLPVVAGDTLVGVLSIGDLIKCQLSDKAHENKMLHDYILGRYPG